MNHRVRWQVSALASAIALLGGLASLDAHALALGRITVLSALGEPLRAEIDITDINAEEANSLKAGVASAEAFKAAGLDYSSTVAGVQVSLQKRADGRSFLNLSSNRPVTEPFVDLVLDASWSSGRMARDYTLLFDPPNLRQSGLAGAPIAPAAPLLSRPLPGVGRTPNEPPPLAAAPPPPPSRPAPVARTRPERGGPAAKPAADGQQLAVRPGDTAGKIAAQSKPASVSLDQMLVAMLRRNPEAFIGGNINRLKSGALLDIPGADEAAAMSSAEASKSIVAQSRDFNDFRRKLAEGVPATQVDGANRQAAGKLQAKVEDRAPASATPDKLTLSRGAVQGKAAAEDKIAKDRQAREASDRVAELAKNIGELNKIAGPAAAPAGIKTPGIAVPVPAVVAPPPSVPASAAPALAAASAAKAIPATPPLAVASAPASAALTAPAGSASAAAAATSTPAAGTTASLAALSPASAPVPAASMAGVQAVTPAVAASAASAPARVLKKPAAPVAPPPERSLLDELTDNSFVVPGLAALLMLLGGMAFLRYKKRNNAVQVDSSFLESRLQPDSFFGASGGQRIDTNEGGATGSSLVYSPSQLDAGGDVDPVAEADVYLAYGRDLQAEEILKEALRTTPTRVAIHAKLLEIYAKRRDIKAFEVVALEAFGMTRGEGSEWAYISEMGRNLDSANPMYQPGGQPGATSREAVEDSHFNSTAGFGSSTISHAIEPQAKEAAGPVDLDLDLDFSLPDEPAGAAPAPVPSLATAAQPSKAAPKAATAMPQDPIFDGLDMDFSSDAVEPKPSLVAPPSGSLGSGAEPRASASSQSFTPEPAPARAVAAAPALLDSGMLEFDLGSLSLDLPGPATESPSTAQPIATAESDDPLATKFALAEEFRALGDSDGARSLAEEVASEASGSLKSKAQAFLNALS